MKKAQHICITLEKIIFLLIMLGGIYDSSLWLWGTLFVGIPLVILSFITSLIIYMFYSDDLPPHLGLTIIVQIALGIAILLFMNAISLHTAGGWI